MKIKHVWLPALVAIIAFSAFCSIELKDHKRKKNLKESAASSIIKYPADNAGACDTSIWRHVYNPSRLQVIDRCMTVTGVIVESSADDDGDQHMLLKLDKGQDNLLKKQNLKKKAGNLVIEAVCMNRISNKKVGSACQGYINHVQLPKMGDHVKVTGSYVLDTHNGWTEIHPISKVEVLK